MISVAPGGLLARRCAVARTHARIWELDERFALFIEKLRLWDLHDGSDGRLVSWDAGVEQLSGASE